MLNYAPQILKQESRSVLIITPDSGVLGTFPLCTVSERLSLGDWKPTLTRALESLTTMTVFVVEEFLLEIKLR